MILVDHNPIKRANMWLVRARLKYISTIILLKQCSHIFICVQFILSAVFALYAALVETWSLEKRGAPRPPTGACRGVNTVENQCKIGPLCVF